MHLLRENLESCLQILKNGGSTCFGDLNTLNDFCAKVFAFSNTLQKSITNQMQPNSLDVVFLCLAQIMICIRHLEYTIKTEMSSGTRIQASHDHFIDRIMVCIKRLHLCLEPSKANSRPGSTHETVVEGVPYLDLLDYILDCLSDFTNYNPDNTHVTKLTESSEDMHEMGEQLKLRIDLLLGQTLSFANVALQQDKKALSALCQKVMRDCSAFQEECKSVSLNDNYSNLKIRAMTLEQAVHQLEDYINEALLRLIFTSFLDFQKISVDKIRNVLRTTNTTDTVDEYIADFDVNLDRATQIGIYAISFAPSLKVKTLVRSCLASFEYLDTSLIPSLYANVSDLHSELLEQHFKEEVSKFKTVLLEIINSHAFIGCYLQMLTVAILTAEKQFDKTPLEELTQMGFFILEHFQIEANQKILLDDGRENLKNVVRILRECKAILMCASQVQTDRIIKRFKILRTILRKLHNNISPELCKSKQLREHSDQAPISETKNDQSNSNFEASPTCSILYNTRKERTPSFSCKEANKNSIRSASKHIIESSKLKAYGCVRRRPSLRTAMFKRQNTVESNTLDNTVSNSQSACLEISDILNQLSCLTVSFTTN